MRKFVVVVFVMVSFPYLFSQYTPKPLSANYEKINAQLAKGWNTWNAHSLLSHVLLPEGFSINLSFKGHWNFYLDQGLSNINRMHYVNKRWPKANEDRNWMNLASYNRPEHIRLGLRSDDGSYTSLIMDWYGMTVDIQTATDGNDWLAIVNVDKAQKNNSLIVETGMMYNREGVVSKDKETIIAKLPTQTIIIRTTNQTIIDNNVPCNNHYIAIPLSDNQIGLYTGKVRTIEEIKQIIANKREQQENRALQYKELSDLFKAMQQSLAWNTIYDGENNRVITPVSRIWCDNWGGWMLFGWDTYFASYMFSMFNKELAFANAIAITKSITEEGFIPNYSKTYGAKAFDRSQPSVGSVVIREIYRKYPEKWFLEEVFNELIIWNRWWPKARDNKGYLCWGSNPDPREDANNTWQGAAYESGLDNSPMYDGIPFNTSTHLMELADVGLMSFYIADCEALADIANVLDKKNEAKELIARANKYKAAIATLWSEEKGIYLNKRTDNSTFSNRLSPTNFYPLLTSAPNDKQTERMMKDHYFNKEEFYGEYVMPSCARNDTAFQGEYWRGRIWGPMNFLVYLGMTKHENTLLARKDLVERSKNMYLKSWTKDATIFENYCSITGKGENSTQSDSYYHWGSLLGFISFIENGYVPKPFAKLK